MTLHAYTDGASRGNPGESGIGVILRDEEGAVVFSGGGYIGLATNNVAEYEALLACLRKALALSPTRLILHSDSQLMVRQLKGEYRVKDKTLLKYYRQVRKLLEGAHFAFEIRHIERELNRDADLLANSGLESRRKLKV